MPPRDPESDPYADRTLGRRAHGGENNEKDTQ
jgi:hypothetical protein